MLTSKTKVHMKLNDKKFKRGKGKEFRKLKNHRVTKN